MSTYAISELIAIIRADAENRIPTDTDKLANDLQSHLPDLTHNELVELIKCCIEAMKGAEAWTHPDS